MKITVTYKKSGESDRSIEALVFYESEDPKDKRIKARFPIPYIIVKNDTTDGIGSSEIDTGSDKISMPIRQGHATSKDFSIRKIITQNCGFLRLRLG